MNIGLVEISIDWPVLISNVGGYIIMLATAFIMLYIVIKIIENG